MNPESLYPEYVPRPEEQLIRDAAAQVRLTGTSRALLLYGPGGVGKTSLVHGLAGTHQADPDIIWLEPVDVDDPEYWLLANLEQKVARQLDPENRYFGSYMKYLSQLPSYNQLRIGRETVVSHLGRIKRVFVDCYEAYINDSGKTVVMTFDTVEAMRGVYLLYTLTQWIKSLPGTFFILSGRPMLQPGDRPDPIRDELEDPHQNLPLTTLTLGPFPHETALDYLRASIRIGETDGDLSPAEAQKLALLTGRNPLWLAFAVSYVRERGMPEEAEEELDVIQRMIPDGDESDREGQRLYEAFKRRLVSPYREVDFWHEAIKRLAVVRQGVTQPIWERLMSDCPAPAGVASPEDAWRILQQTPWVRTRANGRYVTLHDAVAEELAQRIIPLHDSEQHWRRELWARASLIYRELTAEPAAELAAMQSAVDDRFRRVASRAGLGADADVETAPDSGPDADEEHAEHRQLIDEVVRLDAQSRELAQLKVVGLHYQLLSDFTTGTRQFIELFDAAKKDYDVFLQDRLALEMQRFLPGSAYQYALDDVVSSVLDDFAVWLTAEGKKPYLEIGMTVASYLIDNEQPQSAIGLLEELPEDIAGSTQRCQLNFLKGNAHMRIPQGMKKALGYLNQALAAALTAESADGRALVAEAYKELGFFYRNAGRWRAADEAYEKARDAILANFSARDSDQDHEDMASIQTNWAYLKGLTGAYRDGSSLVDSAIDVRRRLNLHLQEGISWSVSGEIYRYERRFEKAWASFAIAEQIFQGRRDWSWLGQIYQEQAICLLQAAADNINLVPGKSPAVQSKHLITLALDICRDQNLRAYPSALNRAGRIYGADEFDTGLQYLDEAIDWARKLSDGWFWFASLLEYVELSYRAWVETGRPELQAAIDGKAPFIQQAMSEYEFSDLRGRWSILQGHLNAYGFLTNGEESRLDSALNNYKEGFRLIAQEYVGSSGISMISWQFDRFRSVFSLLPREVRVLWLDELRLAWRNLENGSTPLLARLEQLY